HRQAKAAAWPRARRRSGQNARQRQTQRPQRGQGRRGHLWPLCRQRHRSRSQGDQDPARDRHPGQGRQVRTDSGQLTQKGAIRYMAKQLLYTDDARKKLLAGADKLSKAVGSTLGPTGRNVIIEKSFGGPTVTKDGVTVSKEIDLADPFENMGAKLVNAVAQKTSDVAGDGTTTATILALSIYQEGLRNITAGANPMAVKRGIDKAVDART